MSIRLRNALLLICGVLLLNACATRIKAPRTPNPPPLELFSNFSRFEVKPVELAPRYARNTNNQRAAAKIQEYFDARVKPQVDQWSAQGAGPSTLVIEPYIEKIKFVPIGKRIMTGALSGSSAVLMKVKYLDKSSGKLIAEPLFYQRAAAMSGAMTFGGQDNAMLARIVTLVTDYNKLNYGQRAGGARSSSEDEHDELDDADEADGAS